MDRQDIDALLIGALYGELTPTDEARLAAHLDSHPTDRGALDDLKSARQAVRESRIFDLQLDPPQSVSALLLQEAHRRAPKRAASRSDEHEGWFFRFTRVFLAHPAMAAAAMLVLVVGVAGTMYMKKGSDQVATQEISAPQAEMAGSSAVVATVPQDPSANDEAPEQTLEGSGSAFRVDLDGKYSADKNSAEPADRGAAAQVAKLKAQQQALERQELSKNNKKSSAIVVDTPRPQPKELPESRAKTATKTATTGSKGGGAADYGGDRFYEDGVVGGASGASTGTGGAPSGRVATTPTTTAGPGRSAPQPPPPPAAATPAPSTVAQGTAKAPAPAPQKPSVAKEAEKSESKPDAAKDSTLIAWAKGEHSRAVALASKGDCSGAAKLAVAIGNRAPDYYSQFVATDRALKKCQAYIAAERDADAERSGKARAQKRVNADEPASSR